MDKIVDVRDNIQSNEDVVNHPNHYNQYDVEVITLTRQMGYDVGNVVKYVLRAPFKKGIEDLQKALWYAKDCPKVTPKYYYEPAEPFVYELLTYFEQCARKSTNTCAGHFASLLYYSVMYELSCTVAERSEYSKKIYDIVDIIEHDTTYLLAVEEYNEAKGISR